MGRWVCGAILALALALKASLQEAAGALVARRLLSQLHYLSEQQQQQQPHTKAPSWGGRREVSGDESHLDAMIAETSSLVLLFTSHPGAVFTPKEGEATCAPLDALTDPYVDCPEVAVHQGGVGGEGVKVCEYLTSAHDLTRLIFI